MRVLIVEDDPMLAQSLKQGLNQAGFTVDVASSAEEAAGMVDNETFDVALIDIGLPGADGLALIQRLRASGNRVPVMVLTARGGMEDTVQGLDAGADDYLAKPFRLPEVLARMRALLRRSHALASSRLQHGALVLDTRSRRAEVDGEALELTNREWAILEQLLMMSPAVVSKDRLVQSLAGWEKDITPNAVEVHVSRLRTKLSLARVVIRTVRGIGYRVDPAAD